MEIKLAAATLSGSGSRIRIRRGLVRAVPRAMASCSLCTWGICLRKQG